MVLSCCSVVGNAANTSVAVSVFNSKVGVAADADAVGGGGSSVVVDVSVSGSCSIMVVGLGLIPSTMVESFDGGRRRRLDFVLRSSAALGFRDDDDEDDDFLPVPSPPPPASNTLDTPNRKKYDPIPMAMNRKDSAYSLARSKTDRTEYRMALVPMSRSRRCQSLSPKSSVKVCSTRIVSGSVSPRSSLMPLPPPEEEEDDDDGKDRLLNILWLSSACPSSVAVVK